MAMNINTTNSGLLLVIISLISIISGLEARTAMFRQQRNNNGTVRRISGNYGICESMIKPFGYLCEEHKVTTKDGYILSLQRIPQGRSSKSRNKTPVLLQHGLIMDGASWLLNSPDESLGFILADNGYDVWIANTRGTKYSRAHTSLDSSDKAYWNWSWDELVDYDLPANVQYVHGNTGQKLHYIGHSLGTLMGFASLSKNSLINVLRSAVLLSPIAHLGQMSSMITRGAADIFLAEDLYWLGIAEFAPGGNAVTDLLENICKLPDTNCANLMTAVSGPNCCVDSSRMDTYLKYEPQSTSTKNLIHVAQMVRQGTIAKYDYGSENSQHYGQPTPPAYNLKGIPNDFPLYLSYGGADYLSDLNDVQTLMTTDLQNHDDDKLVHQYIATYAHADFVIGANANKMVYDPILAFFKLNSD